MAKEIKKEKFKAMPSHEVTIKPHEFEGEYEKSGEYLVKDEKDGGKYKIIERSALIHGTLRDLDDKNSHKNKKEDRKIEKGEKLCDFNCEKCGKLTTGECREESVVCDTCDGKVEAIYYRKKTDKGETLYLKPFSLKIKEKK